MYCGAHETCAECNNPKHDRPIFSQALLERWQIYCAQLVPKLVTSQKVLAQVKIIHSLLDLVQVRYMCVVQFAPRELTVVPVVDCGRCDYMQTRPTCH